MGRGVDRWGAQGGGNGVRARGTAVADWCPVLNAQEVASGPGSVRSREPGAEWMMRLPVQERKSGHKKAEKACPLSAVNER